MCLRFSDIYVQVSVVNVYLFSYLMIRLIFVEFVLMCWNRCDSVITGAAEHELCVKHHSVWPACDSVDRGVWPGPWARRSSPSFSLTVCCIPGHRLSCQAAQ